MVHPQTAVAQMRAELRALMALARCTGGAELLVGGHQIGAVVGGMVVAVFVRHGVRGAPVIVHGLGYGPGVGVVVSADGVCDHSWWS